MRPAAAPHSCSTKRSKPFKEATAPTRTLPLRHQCCEPVTRSPRPLPSLAEHPRARAPRVRECAASQVSSVTIVCSGFQQGSNTKYTNAKSRSPLMWIRPSSRLRGRGLGAPLHAAGCKAGLASDWPYRHDASCLHSKTAVARATKHFTHQSAPQRQATIQGVCSVLSTYPAELRTGERYVGWVWCGG